MSETSEQVRAECPGESSLCEFALGRLNSQLRAQVAGHLRDCSACAADLDRLRIVLEGAEAADAVISAAVDASAVRLEHSTQMLVPDPSPNGPFAPLRMPPTTASDLPERIGDYFIIRLLGQGGFGRVYLARDLPGNRLVAIKVPRPDRLLTEERRASFLTDARSIAALDHAHIVRLLDWPLLDGGQCCLVMDYVEGESLDRIMRRQRLSPQRAAEIVIQIAEALDYAHRQNIWHRDVKPGNIMLDRAGNAYLADFGLAIHQDQLVDDGEECVGTLPYMSPEQLNGQIGESDGRADVWSLGIVLFELLVGERPFPGPEASTLRQQICQRPPLPLAAGNAKIPEPLLAICGRCLEKRPQDRYQTAGELASDLRAAFPVRRRRRPVVVIAAATVLGGVVLAGALAWRPAVGPAAGPAAEGNDGTGTARQNAANGDLPRSSGPPATGARRPLLGSEPTRVAFPFFGPNRVDFDRAQQRLRVRHATDRGLLSCGELGDAKFDLRFVVTIENWQGAAGCFWALQQDPEAFPDVGHRCLALMLRQNAGDLLITLEELGLRPSPLDNTQLLCWRSNELARGRTPLPESPRLAVQWAAQELIRGEVSVNGAMCRLDYLGALSTCVVDDANRFGFVVFDAAASFENASLSPATEE